MILRIHDVVIFKMNDYLMSLVTTQDQQKIRSYDKKTARIIRKVEEVQTTGIFYTIRFPDGFILKEIASSHLEPILASKYKSNFRR